MSKHGHVSQDGLGGNRLGGWLIAGKTGERSGHPVHGREQVDRCAFAGPQMQVKLIDGLKVGDLKEQRAPAGQDVGRPDCKRVMARLAWVTGRQLG